MKMKIVIKGFVALSLVGGHVAQAAQTVAQSSLNIDVVETAPPVIFKPIPAPAQKPTQSSSRPTFQSAPSRPVVTQAGNMAGIQQSMVPGITCPLVENRPHADLLGAIENLNRYVKTTPNCKDNGDAEKMSQTAQGMQKSGAALQEYWKNPQVLTEDPAKLMEFQKHMENVVAGINNVGETLANSSLMKTECGKSLTGKTSVLLAFSDLATSLAPMALLGASLNPSWSVALKVILGVVGLGSTAKIFSTMYEKGTLDMKIPENRMAVLQNTCEFSRIAQRVRFLKLAQSGQINQVTQEIKMYKTQTDSSLKSQFSSRVSDMLSFRNQINTILNDVSTALEKDSKSVESAQARMKMTDENLVCMFAQDIISRFDDANSFPARPVSNLQKLIANQQEISLDQEFLIKSEGILRNKIKNQNSAASAEDITKCATDGRSYVATLASIVRQTEATVRSHRASLYSQLSKDKEFASYQLAEAKAYREVDTLAKIGNILERLNKDNSIIDKSEMHQQMAALKYALFNTDSWIKSSPVMAWLKHSNKMYAESIGRFNTEMSSLIYGAQGITKSGNRIPMPPRSDFNNERYFKEVSQYVRDTAQTSKLGNVTLALAPVGTPQNKDICQHLESAWLEWASALDHLSAQDFFCKTISNLMDQAVEPGIKDHCYGKVDFAGKVQQKSLIAAQQSTLVEIGAKAQAQLVSKKLKELQCEMPNATAAMN